MNDISLTAGMRNNLVSLQKTRRKADATQERLATGKQVNSPLDNPTNFFAAKSHLARASDLDRLRDGIIEGFGALRATSKGLEGILSLLDAMNGIVNAAEVATSPSERQALAQNFDETYSQLNSLVRDSGYGGTNLLSNNSGNLMQVVTDDLAVSLSPDDSAQYVIAGQFMGSGYVLHETPGGQPAWVPDERGNTVSVGDAGGGSVGNLTEVALVIRMAPQVDSIGDVNGDGVLQQGEGTEIDFRLTNSGSAAATNVSFANATLTTGWPVAFNTGAFLGNVPAGQTVITDNATDLDLNIPPGTNGTPFSISLDFTSDGITKNLTFGPFTVGAITNGQTITATSSSSGSGPGGVPTDTITFTSVDYETGTFGVTFPGPPPEPKTLYVEKQGLQIYHSWLYDGFQTTSGINAARTDIANAVSSARSYAATVGGHSATLVTRQEFNGSLSAVHLGGADNLLLADMNEEAASLLMLQTRENLSVQSLSLSSQAAQAVLRFFT